MWWWVCRTPGFLQVGGSCEHGPNVGRHLLADLGLAHPVHQAQDWTFWVAPQVQTEHQRFSAPPLQQPLGGVPMTHYNEGSDLLPAQLYQLSLALGPGSSSAESAPLKLLTELAPACVPAYGSARVSWDKTHSECVLGYGPSCECPTSLPTSSHHAPLLPPTGLAQDYTSWPASCQTPA